MILSKAGVLAELEKLGKQLALQANPDHWAFEDRSRAADYEPKLRAARFCWANIKHDRGTIRGNLMMLNADLGAGIEANRVTLLVTAATTGFDEFSGWTVENDALVCKFGKEKVNS